MPHLDMCSKGLSDQVSPSLALCPEKIDKPLLMECLLFRSQKSTAITYSPLKTCDSPAMTEKKVLARAYTQQLQVNSPPTCIRFRTGTGVL